MMKSAAIISTGSYVPAKKVTNLDLMGTLDTSDGKRKAKNDFSPLHLFGGW